MKNINEIKPNMNAQDEYKPKRKLNKAGEQVINNIFEVLQTATPAIKHVFKKDEGSLDRCKALWARTFLLHSEQTGKPLQWEKGLEFALLDPSPFMPSPAQFIEWCEKDTNCKRISDRESAYNRFLARTNPLTSIEAITRNKCGYRARREPEEKARKLFFDTYDMVFREQGGVQKKLIDERPAPRKFEKRSNQKEIHYKKELFTSNCQAWFHILFTPLQDYNSKVRRHIPYPVV